MTDGKLTPRQRRRVFDEDGPFCRYCGLEGEISKGTNCNYSVRNDEAELYLCVDHVVPDSRGGTDKRRKLQVLCSTCNSIKGSRLESELIAVLMNRNRELQIQNQALRNRLRGH